MILKAQDLEKSYGSVSVLKKVSLEIKEKETVAIQGKSGEGKTTLLHILGTLEKPDRGELLFQERKITRKNLFQIRNQEIGFIFQSHHLLEDLSVLDNILMPARIAYFPLPLKRARELLELVGLHDVEEKKAKYLSGGEKQRVAIARALCNDPPLLLADEPTGNLDSENKQKIIQLLLNLDKTIVLVTHDGDLAKLCQKTIHPFRRNINSILKDQTSAEVTFFTLSKERRTPLVLAGLIGT